MRILSILLLCMALAACGGSGSGSRQAGGEPDPFSATWTYGAPGRSRGVALTPDGDVILAVAQGDAPFDETGGVVILAPDGAVKAELPLAVPAACEGCTRLAFEPNRPLVTGGVAWVSDYHWNLFRIDLATGEARWARLTGTLDVPGIVGLDDGSAAGEGGLALLAGLALTRLDLEAAAVLDTHSLDGPVRAIAALGEGIFLLDLTEPLASSGRLALWDAADGSVETLDLPWPVAAIAAVDGWAVAALELGLGSYGLLELGPDGIAELATFEAPVGPLSLALLPDERVVAVGSGGIRSPSAPDLLVGSTLLVDADEGPLAALDTSSVIGLAFSAGGDALYVADTGGLQAFAFP